MIKNFFKMKQENFLKKKIALRSRSCFRKIGVIDKIYGNKIVDLGWTGIRIPEEFDGLGLGHLELCVIAEELGRFLAPVPFSSSVYLFTEAIVKYGSEDLKKNIVPKLVSGEIVGTLAIAEDFLAPITETYKLKFLVISLMEKKLLFQMLKYATHAIIVCKVSKWSDLRLNRSFSRRELIQSIKKY